MVHLDVYQADSPDLPKRAVDWLRERDLPVTYVAFLRANPQAHMRAILVEARRCLHHSSAKMEKERAQLRKEHQPNLRTRPDPQIEGRILALEGQLAWMRGEIKELTAQIGKRLTPQHHLASVAPPPGSRALFCLHGRRFTMNTEFCPSCDTPDAILVQPRLSAAICYSCLHHLLYGLREPAARLRL